MVEFTRRRLLAGVTTAALAGCMSDQREQAPASTPSNTDGTTPTTTSTETEATETPTPSLPEDVVAALEPIPATIDETPVLLVQLVSPAPENDDSFNQLSTVGTVDAFGIAPTDVDRAALARYGTDRQRLVTLVGSFEADEPTVPDEMPEQAIARADGRLVVAIDGSGNPWGQGLAAAKDAKSSAGLELATDVRLAIAQVAESTLVQVLVESPEEGTTMLDLVNREDVSAFTMGIERLDSMTAELSLTVVYAEESAFDRAAFEKLVTTFGASSEGLTVDRDGRVAVGRTTMQLPTEEIRERVPSPFLGVEYDPERGTAKIQNHEDEPLETEPLTVLVDSEPIEDPWDGDTLQPEETVSVEADLLSVIMIEWTDPEHPAYQRIVFHDVVTDGVRFEESYDITEESLTVTYTGPGPIERTDRIEIERRSADEETTVVGEESNESLASRFEQLSDGDELTFENVAFGDRVSLSATYSYERDSVSGSASTMIYSFRARVPGRFSLEREDTTTLTYYGDDGRDPGNFRVTVDGTDPATGLAEKYDTLNREDTLALAAEPGEQVVVEWTGTGGPAETFSEYVEPPADFELARTEDGFEIVYRGEQYAADAFAVGTDDDREPIFAEEYDTLEDGDSVVLESVGMSIRVYWTEPPEPISLTWLTPTHPLQFELEGSTLKFTGDGEWPAEEFAVTVDGESVSGFTGTVTNGDSIDLDGETGSTVEVEWTYLDRTRTVVSETLHPPLTFTVEEEAKSLTITSNTDAKLDPDALEVTVRRTDESERYPGAWADAYDTVEQGDSITLSTAGEIEGVVIEYDEWDTYTRKDRS